MAQILDVTGYSSNQIKNKNNNTNDNYYSIDEYDIENQNERKPRRKKPTDPFASYDSIDKPAGIQQWVGNNTINDDDGIPNLSWRKIGDKKYPPLRKMPTDLQYKADDESAMMRANTQDGPIAFGGKKTRKKRSRKTRNKSLKKRRKKSYKKRGKK